MQQEQSQNKIQKLLQAITERHSVRNYLSTPLSQEVCQQLQREMEQCCKETPLHMQLITNEPTAFKGIASYGMFQGVENYIIVSKPKEGDWEELVGYCGEQLVLAAQVMGLNTCWVGVTYKKVHSVFSLPQDSKVACIITIGYGKSQGTLHKKKSIEELSNCSSTSPEWFRRGVEAAQLAPSAINQQKFYFKLTNQLSADNLPIVEAKRSFSLIGYTKMDLGIAKYHFELAAGKDIFRWQ